MSTGEKPTTLFLDIGGVLLTNGWDRAARAEAARRFGLDADELAERHHLTYDTYEEGRLDLDGYLDRTVFHRKRPFTRGEFREFLFSRSKPLEPMIRLMRGLRERHGLRVFAVSNEGREPTEYRIAAFGLASFIDGFISSCFVHRRKPDADIYRIALDVSQAPPERVVYVDDRALFVETARRLGIRGIVHVDFESTRSALAAFGLDSPADDFTPAGALHGKERE